MYGREKAECADVGLPILFVLALIGGIGVHHEMTKPDETAPAVVAEDALRQPYRDPLFDPEGGAPSESEAAAFLRGAPSR